MVYKRLSQDGDFTLYTADKEFSATPFSLISQPEDLSFIEAFQKTSYFSQILKDNEVIAIFVGGSRACGLADESSDYDLTVLTLGGEFFNTIEEQYLRYKGKKVVHWYIMPIFRLFDWDASNTLRFAGYNVLRFYGPETAIYENPRYANLIQVFYKMQKTISDIGLYFFYYSNKNTIDDILAKDVVSAQYYSKKLYYLCLSSYLLLDEEIDKEFLIRVKRFRRQKLTEEDKNHIIERLQKLKDYIESSETKNKINPDRTIEEILLDKGGMNNGLDVYSTTSI